MGFTRRFVIFPAVFFLLFCSFSSAGEPLRPIKADKPPVIDGKLDDAAWTQAPFVTGFKTFIPDFGRSIPESTVAWMAFDDHNLFFAFRCFDPSPNLIKASMTSRDNIRPEDWVCINLDSFNDQQSLYAFYVNPYGVQSDSRYSAGTEDFSIDLIWYSAGMMNEDGYTVEIQIPLKSIRYSTKEPVQMSIFFERQVSRRGEHVSFPELDPKRGYAFLPQMQQLVYPGLKPSTLFEILPGVTYSQKYDRQQGALSQTERQAEASLTTKLGLTSDLILDGTYNPDFSQIEADAGQVDVNLRFALFYPEKRPFFLEGSENFNLAGVGDNLQSVVHTRTIVDPVLGLKISGKLGSSSTLASVFAVDEVSFENPLRRGKNAYFPIVRYKEALGDDSYLGAVYTGRELAESFNRVLGVDGQLRMTPSSMLEFHALGSQSKVLDDEPQLIGHSIALVYRNGTRDLDFSFGVRRISKEFLVETGYLTRNGILSLAGIFRPKFYPSWEIVRRVDLELASTQRQDEYSQLWETTNALTANHVFVNGMNLKFRYAQATEVFLGQRFATSSLLVSGGGQATNQLNVSAQYTHARAIYYSAFPYQGKEQRLSASVRYQPWNQFEVSGSVAYSLFVRESDDSTVYDYPISRLRLTYQFSRYLFVRGIAEYNRFRRTLLTDFLVSFTTIPGTVLFAGYGSLYQKVQWENSAYVESDGFLEMKRGFFFKMSYLWRM